MMTTLGFLCRFIFNLLYWVGNLPFSLSEGDIYTRYKIYSFCLYFLVNWPLGPCIIIKLRVYLHQRGAGPPAGAGSVFRHGSGVYTSTGPHAI